MIWKMIDLQLLARIPYEWKYMLELLFNNPTRHHPLRSPDAVALRQHEGVLPPPVLQHELPQAAPPLAVHAPGQLQPVPPRVGGPPLEHQLPHPARVQLLHGQLDDVHAPKLRGKRVIRVRTVIIPIEVRLIFNY